jgi:Bacterial regulatory proteins, lacI family
MASILEIARLANVSADNVLRVVNGEPVSADVASRVASAIEAVGPPTSARSRAEIAATEKRSGSEATELVSRVDQMAAELEHGCPRIWAASSTKRFASRCSRSVGTWRN